MSLAMCALGLMLWTGSFGGRGTAQCCLEFFQLGLPPPDRPAMVGIDAYCKVKAKPRRRWRRRHELYGTDDNGVITLTLCKDTAAQKNCCQLTAVGPTGTLITPKPTRLTGTYTCPEGSGTYELHPDTGGD